MSNNKGRRNNKGKTKPKAKQKKYSIFGIFNKISANFHNITTLPAAQKCSSAYATLKKHHYQIEQMTEQMTEI